MNSANYQQLIVGLSEAIAQALVSLRAEEHHPQYGADQSDFRVNALRSNVAKLHQMRHDLEEIAAAPVIGGY